MVQDKLQSGYINCLNKPYIFTYDGELLQLVPKEKTSIKPYDFLENKKMYYRVLEGSNIRNYKIFFLNCHLYGSVSNYVAKPAGYAYFINRERKFDVITFKGGIVDYFYGCNHIIDEENTHYNYDTGEAVLKLRAFDETSKQIEVEIAGRKALLTLGVTLPEEPLYMKIDYNLGKPKSIFRLAFYEPVDIEEFQTIYMWIYNLMSFLNFRKDISMGKIELGKINEEKRIEYIGSIYLNEKEKKNVSDGDRYIGYYFVFEHINDLLQIVNKKNLNLLFIPQNEKDSKYISAEKYMICCTSFESVFNYVFPKAKEENSKKVTEVKNEFLQYIESRREAYKGKDGKKRKEFQKYANIIKLLDFGLAEKFDYCNSVYEESIDEYKNRILYKTNLSQKQLDEISLQFAEKRNLLVHSSIEGFDDIHVFAYLLARVFIYMMILSKANIDSSMIIQAINKIL